MEDSAASIKVPSSAALSKHMFYVCPECGATSDTQQEWRRHLNDVHGYSSRNAEALDFIELDRKYHQCQICLQRIANAHHSPVILQYHRFIHLPYSPYRCKYCPGSYAKKRTLSVHIFRFHKRLINSLDRQRMDPKYNKEFYMRFICPQCGKQFDHCRLWEKHIDEAHLSTSINLGMHRIEGTLDYYCDECSDIIKNNPANNELRRHHFTHMPRPEYFKCAFCSAKESYKMQIFLHFIKCHNEEYLKNVQFICKPTEWGVSGQNGDVQDSSSDILRTALVNSAIDLDEENENVISQPNGNGKQQQADSEFNHKLDINDDELEEICKEIFEEIGEEKCQSLQKNEVKCSETVTFTAKLRLEMQKYFNYLCPICLKEFSSQPTWRSHVFEQHNLANDVKSKFRPLNAQKTAYICLVCHQVQRNAKHTDLQRHHFQHMPHQGYLKCTLCAITKSSKTKMLHHMKYIHRIQVEAEDGDDDNGRSRPENYANSFCCLECDEVFDDSLKLKNHYKICRSRLLPIAVGQYDIAKNMRLLEHLKNASIRIDHMLREEGIDVNSIKLAYK